MIKSIDVKTAGHPYKIYIGKNALKDLPGLVKKSGIGQDAVLVTTPPVRRLYEKRIKRALRKACRSMLILTVPDSEKSKNAGLALRLIEKITRFDRHKRLFLVAFGGGVVGDLTGFMAAVYKRGVPYIQVPTTLLAQIDSSIGGKTAVDTKFGKNLVGAFYQPRFILTDTNLLSTLPRKEMLAGLCEAVKYAVIKDKKLFSFLRKDYRKVLKKDPGTLLHLIVRCATIKARVVARDEFDKKGVRVVLNFGHTVGHAIEAASHFKISHGEAVSLGMIAACRLSRRLGLLREGEASAIIGLIKRLGLPQKIKDVKARDILKSLVYDKKFTKGTNRFVLLKRIGGTKIVENIPLHLVRETVAEELTKS